MLIVGLTGGIGSGKSTVAELFKKEGAPIVDADLMSHQLCEPGKEGYHKIIAHFGASVLQDNGQIDRKKLADIVFTQDIEREWLEAMLHPLIRQEMRDQTKTIHAPYCIFVIPLLTEAHDMDHVDRVLVVDAPEALQIERASKRDHRTVDDIKNIMAVQNSREQRLAYADDVIVNDADIDSLQKKVAKLHQYYSSR